MIKEALIISMSNLLSSAPIPDPDSSSLNPKNPYSTLNPSENPNVKTI